MHCFTLCLRHSEYTTPAEVATRLTSRGDRGHHTCLCLHQIGIKSTHVPSSLAWLLKELEELGKTILELVLASNMSWSSPPKNPGTLTRIPILQFVRIPSPEAFPKTLCRDTP